MKIFIKRSQSFPSFHTVRNDIELEEIGLDHLAASTPYTVPLGKGSPPQQQLPPRPPQQEPPCPLVAPPSPAPPPTMVAKARVRARGKARTMAPVAPVRMIATIAGEPHCGPPSTLPRLALSRCCQGCVLLHSSRRIHRSTPCLLHRRTMMLPTALASCPCLRLNRTNNRSWPLPGHPRWARGINSHWLTLSAPWS
jgi:hypothetical protein